VLFAIVEYSVAIVRETIVAIVREIAIAGRDTLALVCYFRMRRHSVFIDSVANIFLFIF
jgi:hypothetical protein